MPVTPVGASGPIAFARMQGRTPNYFMPTELETNSVDAKYLDLRHC